jgi:hypothetical protein
MRSRCLRSRVLRDSLSKFVLFDVRANVVRRTHRARVPASLDLSQDPDDLLLAESTPFHGFCSF